MVCSHAEEVCCRAGASAAADPGLQAQRAGLQAAAGEMVQGEGAGAAGRACCLHAPTALGAEDAGMPAGALGAVGLVQPHAG